MITESVLLISYRIGEAVPSYFSPKLEFLLPEPVNLSSILIIDLVNLAMSSLLYHHHHHYHNYHCQSL